MGPAGLGRVSGGGDGGGLLPRRALPRRRGRHRPQERLPRVRGVLHGVRLLPPQGEYLAVISVSGVASCLSSPPGRRATSGTATERATARSCRWSPGRRRRGASARRTPAPAPWRRRRSCLATRRSCLATRSRPSPRTRSRLPRPPPTRSRRRHTRSTRSTRNMRSTTTPSLATRRSRPRCTGRPQPRPRPPRPRRPRPRPTCRPRARRGGAGRRAQPQGGQHPRV